MSTRQIVPTLLFALIAAACTEPRPELPIEGSFPMEPVPAEYAGYAKEIQACSGHVVPADVSYFEYPGKFFLSDGFRAIGLYQYVARRITLTTTAKTSPLDVRHEQLHAALGVKFAAEDDAAAHPVEYFGEPGSKDPAKQGKCGTIVSH